MTKVKKEKNEMKRKVHARWKQRRELNAMSEFLREGGCGPMHASSLSEISHHFSSLNHSVVEE